MNKNIIAKAGCISALFGLLLVSQNAWSKKAVTKYQEPCDVLRNPSFEVDYCKTTKNETWYGEGANVEAGEDCVAARQAVTDYPVTSCTPTGHESWGVWYFENQEWERCQNLGDNVVTCDASDRWTGKYYFGNCPVGTLFDAELGCVQDDFEPDACSVESASSSIGNPIHLGNGNKHHKELIEIGSESIQLTLSYNSNLRRDEWGIVEFNHLAPGWTHNYNFGISTVYEAYGETFVYIKRPNGRNMKFVKSGGVWQSALPSDMQLTETVNGWELLTGENTREVYVLVEDRKAAIESMHFSNGHSLTFENSTSSPDLLGKVIDEFGGFIKFHYNWSSQTGHRIYQISNHQGHVWNFGYHNTSKNLESVLYPDTSTKQFHYEDATHTHALTGITDQRGVRFATYQYDASQRVVYEKHHAVDESNNPVNVEELTIVYNADNTRTVTNSRGQVSTYTLQKLNGLWKITDLTGPGCSTCSMTNSSFSYDPVNNNLLSKTQDGLITHYGNYDAKGQYGHRIEAFGTAEQRQIDFTYDARFFNKPLTITEDSVFTGQDKVTTYTYNSTGQMTSMSVSGHKPDGTAISRSTTYQYNGPFNQLSQIDGPRTDLSDVTTFTYYSDTDPVVHNRNRLEKVTNAAGLIERDNIQWSATGKVLSEDRLNGLSIANVYDANTDRLTTVTQTVGSDSIVTAFTYLATGELATVTRFSGTPQAQVMTLAYDDALRLIRITDSLGNYIKFTLDTEGNQLAEKTYDPQDALKKMITQTFDAYDQVDVRTQSGVGVDFDFSSDRTLDQQTNGNGVITDYSYDALRRLTQISQDDGGSIPATADTDTAFTYDAQDRVKTVTDARGNTTTYLYDDLGHLITLISPDTGTTQYAYDAAGNMTQKTDANGITVTMSYDALNRHTGRDFTDNTLDVGFTFDQGATGQGMMTAMSDQSGSTAWTYSGFGQLTSKLQQITGYSSATVTGFNNLDLVYTHDDQNRVETVTYPSGVVLSYQYDGMSRIEKITAVVNGSPVDVVDDIEYMPFGPVTGLEFGSRMIYSAVYDDGYRLSNLAYASTVTAGYSYDGNHNITAIDRESAPLDNAFTYDRLDRLTSNRNGYENFTYDKLGNRSSQQTGFSPPIPYFYDSNSNRLLAFGGFGSNRQYDANGNTLSMPSKNLVMTYNQANRLASVTNGTTLQGEYQYNGLGQRVLRKKYNSSGVLNGEFLYVYDQSGHLVHESKYKNNDHKWDRETVWLNDRPVAQIRTLYSAGVVSSQDIYYILTDHLDTPRWVTDSNGTTLWSWESDAFGTNAPNQDVDGDATEFSFNLRFPGQFYDSESGQHYNYFRDYEPSTGRYVESDPIGLDGGLNTYIYVLANPIILQDIFGLCGMTRSGCEPGYRVPVGGGEYGCSRPRYENVPCPPPPCTPETCCNQSFSTCYSNCKDFYQSTVTFWNTVELDAAATAGAGLISRFCKNGKKLVKKFASRVAAPVAALEFLVIPTCTIVCLKDPCRM